MNLLDTRVPGDYRELYFIEIRGRQHVRTLPPQAPHIVREGRLWVCTSPFALAWGYGLNASAALTEWCRLNNIPSKARSRPLMAPVGHYPTESSLVPTPPAVPQAV